MIDVLKPATVRGFPVTVADIGDQMHLCHPLLSFEGDDALYLAHKLDWANSPDALAIADRDEAAAHGTLLPPTCSPPIASGEGLIVMGTDFVQAAVSAGVDLVDSAPSPVRTDGLAYWMVVATPAHYAALRARLAEEARGAFDEALDEAVRLDDQLAERGAAALLLMRRCTSGSKDALAVRQLAGALQDRQFDLYRRLLLRYALELGTSESVLVEEVTRYLES